MPSEGWKNGSTWQWRKIRKQVLQRDGYRCQVKLEGCTTRADCVHHLDGKVQGDDPSRLVASCTHCNLKIGDPNRIPRDPGITRRTQW